MVPPSSRAKGVALVRRAILAGKKELIRPSSSLAGSRFVTSATTVNPQPETQTARQQQDGFASFSTTSGKTKTPLPPVEELMAQIARACLTNQGNPTVKSKRIARRQYFWDYEFCRTTADAYEKYLIALADNPHLAISPEQKETLLAPLTVQNALTALLKCKLKPNKLSARVRKWERALGTLAATPLTDDLSKKLVEANGKAGNIGRVLSLLEYRTQQSHAPTRQEFIHAVTAVEAAGWHLRENRNIFLGDRQQPVVDNPTRWLDAILLNMSQRNFPLDVGLAVRMLDTFATRGRTGKAMHYFYSVHKTPMRKDGEEEEEMEEEMEEELDEDDDLESDGLEFNSSVLPSKQMRPHKIRLKLKTPPPFYKIPTEVEGQLLAVPKSKKKNKSKSNKDDKQKNNDGNKVVLKLDRESEPDWSIPLTAAFSFADSLTHGACGHEPMELDLVCYNVLIKTCVYRGALWRAMHLLDDVMPGAGIEPDQRSYNSLLSGLARVGDVTMMREYYQQMLSKDLDPSYYTVQCIVDGLLNLGDVAGAITVIQDFFNQHNVLPPVTTQLKVLEFALGLDMLYEAKRHVYFIQQLWKWEPHYQYETKDYIYMMKTYQQDPRISKEALKHLFQYFGEKLEESDFF